MTVEDERFSYGEQRFVAFGLLQGRVVAIVTGNGRSPHRMRSQKTRLVALLPFKGSDEVTRRLNHAAEALRAGDWFLGWGLLLFCH